METYSYNVFGEPTIRDANDDIISAMDEHNNSIGRGLAVKTDSDSCAYLCKKALNDGVLKVIFP